MTSDHQPNARREGTVHRSMAEAEASQGKRLDTYANVAGAAVGAATLAAALQGYDRYMALISGRDARGRRVSRMNRNPSSRSQRRDL